MTTALVTERETRPSPSRPAAAAAGLPALRRDPAAGAGRRSARSVSVRSSRCTIPTGRSPTPRRSPPARRRSGATASGSRSRVSRSLSLDSGFTPLVEAPELARRLGVARLWIKNDAVCHPSSSFKDRVVAAAINAARALGLDTVGCASTGNLANAVAAQAARAGLPAWIFIPHDLELGKVVGTAVYDPRLVRVRGNYDDVNRLCAQAADRFGWGLVNINLRGYYGEGSKTVAFEIAEQLGWRAPTAVVAPMAGGSLVTKLEKGFGEFARAGLVSGAGAATLRRPGGRAARRSCGWWSRGGEHDPAGRPEHDRALDRDRQSGRRPLRRARRSAGAAAGSPA